VQFETSVDIEASSDIVWGILVDVGRWPEWTESVQEVRWLGEATLSPGSRVRIKQPRMSSLVWEVSGYEPRASFTWRNTSPGVTTVGTHVITERGGDRVTVTLGIQQSGVLARVIGLLTGARTKRYVQMEADGLKKRAEAAP